MERKYIWAGAVGLVALATAGVVGALMSTGPAGPSSSAASAAPAAPPSMPMNVCLSAKKSGGVASCEVFKGKIEDGATDVVAARDSVMGEILISAYPTREVFRAAFDARFADKSARRNNVVFVYMNDKNNLLAVAYVAVGERGTAAVQAAMDELGVELRRASPAQPTRTPVPLASDALPSPPASSGSGAVSFESLPSAPPK